MSPSLLDFLRHIAHECDYPFLARASRSCSSQPGLAVSQEHGRLRESGQYSRDPSELHALRIQPVP